MMKTKIFVAKTIAKKSYKDAMDAMKSLSGKAKNEAALVKLAGVKNYSKLRMNRMKKSSTFKKTKKRINTMPMVGKKKYPYTKKGKAAAKKAAKKMGKKVKRKY